MKVVRSVRAAYQLQLEINERLQERCRAIIKPGLEPRWHYEDRVKGEESFALKLETGRFKPEALEDFFACTIVVENADSIKRALKQINKVCIVMERRPRVDQKTHKGPEQFPFDDLRLYVKFKPDPALPPKDTDELIFEVQIKTYLQHAWAIATHDLIYKFDDVSWAQQRIAYQTKAVLESAETAISSSKELAKGPTIAKEDRATEKLKKIISFIKQTWKTEQLPADITRMAKTLLSFTEATNLSVREIEGCLKAETGAGRGTKIQNLPPYLVIIQSLLTSNNVKFKTFLSTEDSANKFKVLMTTEITTPPGYPSIVEAKVIRC